MTVRTEVERAAAPGREEAGGASVGAARAKPRLARAVLRTRRCFAASAMLLAAGAGSACGSSEPPPPSVPAQPLATAASTASAGTARQAPAPTAATPPDAQGEQPEHLAASEIATTLEVVSRVRGLPIRRSVRGTILDREAVIRRIIAKVERNLPPEALEAQAELLAGLGLIPADYDYVAGIYSILKENVAGFYDPEDASMVLLDDLNEDARAETLAHELVHALQDQHYALEPLLKYRPHDSDRVAAVQVLSEGDATSAMFDLSTGSAFNVSESVLRLALAASTALSESGADTPKLLHLALVAPYVDGFAFVQQMRRRGGWRAVDDAWRALPTTTEQLLHLDKFDAREPPIQLAPPSLDGLGDGWSIVDHDVLGEQGLRIALETWVDRTTATAAAAGWGGDRYVVARRPLPTEASPGSPSGPPGAAPGASASRPLDAPATARAALAPPSISTSAELVAAWLIQFDTAADAAELARVLRSTLGPGCEERPLLGPRLWSSFGTKVVLAAGPFRRDANGQRVRGDAGCGSLRRWAAGLVRSR